MFRAEGLKKKKVSQITAATRMKCEMYTYIRMMDRICII